MSEKKLQKVHLVSLGCPKNTVDSERMLGLLEGNEYLLTEAPEEADVVVVNTCGFIGPAKEESIDAIMEAHRLKQEGKCKGVVVTGCLSTRYYDELQQELTEADKLAAMNAFRKLDNAYCTGEPFVSYLFALEYILNLIGRGDIVPYINKICCRKRRHAYQRRLERIFHQ